MWYSWRFAYINCFGYFIWSIFFTLIEQVILTLNDVNPVYPESTQFDEIEIDSDMMIYCDPPYGRIKEEDGSLGKKQISEAGYNAFWLKEDDIKLYNFLINADKVGASFMVSGVLHHDGKTCWMLDKLISDGFRYKVIEYDYNKVSRKGDKETREIIITNYEN